MAKEVWEYGTLYYNPNAGEGEIELWEDFHNEHFVIQLDILQDWRYYLDNLYDKILEESRL
jgi:hypothetical protein